MTQQPQQQHLQHLTCTCTCSSSSQRQPPLALRQPAPLGWPRLAAPLPTPLHCFPSRMSLLAARDHDTLAAVRGAVAATALPAAVRGRTRFHELPDAGHWVRGARGGDEGHWAGCSLDPKHHAGQPLPALDQHAAMNNQPTSPPPPPPPLPPPPCYPLVRQVHTDNPRGLVSLMLPSMLEAAGA